MKHTPGPWAPALYRVTETMADRLKIGSVHNAVAMDDDKNNAQGMLIALCGDYEDPHDQSAADARLIAAAPEMLDAIGAVLDFINDFCYEDIWRNNDHDTRHFCPMCNCTTGHEDECPIPLLKLVYKKAKNGTLPSVEIKPHPPEIIDLTPEQITDAKKRFEQTKGKT